MKSPIYWHPKIYRLVIRILEGKDFKKRCKFIINEIGNYSVLDIGCADCYLSKFIKKDKYLGIDINKMFIYHARKNEINAELLDIREGKIPEKECIVLSNILHQFYPNHKHVLKEIFKKPVRKVIIAENINPISLSSNKIIASIAMKLNDPGHGVNVKNRFTKNELISIYKEFHATKINFFGNTSIAVFTK